MNFREELEERVEYIKNHEDEELIIYMINGYKLKHRSNCSAEFHEDEVVFFNGDYCCVVRYEAIKCLHVRNRGDPELTLDDIIKS